MARQLQLLEDDGTRVDDWRLDDATKETGRRGLADARRALAEATKRAAA